MTSRRHRARAAEVHQGDESSQPGHEEGQRGRGARIGSKQLDLLIMTASPTCALLTTDKVSAALVRRGLLREREPGGACCITAAGLRVLADEMQAGRVDDALVRMKKEADSRRAKIAERAKARAMQS